ncbi:hypothetical protein AWC38_SpisGene12136 [Stylophora pistillata]|uniref:Uncharacterized protein n=1 Tax=Stylophora pistillata TaxID=50429 RepID=A0A2B4S1P1_STYPI|nr:hypothetical protein AWC38_SpisGene12136 [Stylophora pistillata]
MFNSALREMKELKQTVATLVEPAYDYDEQGDKQEESDEGTATGEKEPAAAGETSKSPAAKASGSKLFAEIVQELDIKEKTGSDVDEGLVKLMGGLLQDKLQEDKVQSRIEKFPQPRIVEGFRTPRVNPLIWNQIPAKVRTSDSKSQNLIQRCVQKIIQDKAKGILLVPVWPTQTWFPLVLQLLYSQPRIFKPSPNLLHHAPLQGATPSTQGSAPDGLSFIRNTFAQQDLPPDITNIIMASWSKGTQNQYKTYVEK